jgi:aspartyl-tRNA(Asn)/glutamyl-tRNA(Gln) amidotransferase subunit A
LNLSYLSIKQIHELYKDKKLAPEELVKYYCARIKKLNPKLNAVLDWSEEKALDQAKKLGKFSEEKLLWGIPVLVKDNFVTRDFKTTASSKILDGYQSPFDAAVVEKLKEQGAIILGKTNLDAFAHGSSTETSDYGTTLNPWDTSKLPGGSSGGSASAVAADLCTVAIGSETAGSVRQPASWCGTVGLKPTYGRVSRWGEILMASSTDCPGVLARSVEDAEIVLKAIEGYDERDAQSIDEKITNYELKITNKKDLKNITIGICEDYFMKETEPEVNEKVQTAIKKLEELGAKVKKIKLLPPKYSIAVYTILQRSEVSSNLGRFDGIRYGGKREVFNEENMRRIMLGTYTLSAGYYDAYYLKAVKVRTLIINDFKKAFEEVDIIIAPTSPSTALPIGSSKNHPMFGEIADVLVESSSIAQLPGININCGFDKSGMPIGMQIIGLWRGEDTIMQVAKQYEENTDWPESHPKI